MKNVKDQITSVWTGSVATLGHVAQQIKDKFGDDAVKIYDPFTNCFTYKRWLQEGYQVRKGEKALTSITWIMKEDETAYPKKVNLFFISQVEKINVGS